MRKLAQNQSVAIVGIDLGKSSFQIFGIDQHGRPKLDKTCSRNQLKLFVANLQPCLLLANNTEYRTDTGQAVCQPA